MNGNTTEIPDDSAGEGFCQIKYYPWNRPVEVKDNAGNIILQVEYDGFGRAIKRVLNGSTTFYYYDTAWRVLEERSHISRLRDYIWGAQYIDELVYRKDYSQDPDLVHYFVQDGNWNVVTLLDSQGSVVERYRYDPYAKVTFLDPNGAEKSESEAKNTSYLFQGRRRIVLSTSNVSVETYHFRHREYLGALGRFMTRDRQLAGTARQVLGSTNSLGQPLRTESFTAWNPIGCPHASGIFLSRKHSFLVGSFLSGNQKDSYLAGRPFMTTNSGNLYEFLLSNPTSKLDPFGLEPEKCSWHVTIEVSYIGVWFVGKTYGRVHAWGKSKVHPDCRYEVSASGSGWIGAAVLGLGWFSITVSFVQEAVCRWPIGETSNIGCGLFGVTSPKAPISANLVICIAGVFEKTKVGAAGGVHLFVMGGGIFVNIDKLERRGPFREIHEKRK